MKPYLEFKSVSKTFPGVVALNNVSYQVKEGSVHGLIGENGAGKSTLLKILSGAYYPTSGEILIDGQQRDFHSTKEALDAGVAVIYQELNLIPEMTVAENLLLGHMPTRSGFLDKREMDKIAEGELKFLLDNIYPETKIKELSIGQRQMIEIGKALLHDAKIIAFDEPTSSLSSREIKQLFKIIKELKETGHSVIYVTHRMEEIFDVCDEVTVFRDGKKIETYTDMSTVNHDLLVKKMVGRSIEDIYSYKPRTLGKTVLEIKDLMGPGLSEPISLNVKSGEIVGFFGLVGAGRTEFLKVLYGAEKKESGSVIVDGKYVNIGSPSKAINEGIALCPEDRKDEGIISVRNIDENINISVRRHFNKAGIFLNKKKETENTNNFIKKLDIKTPSKEQIVGNLSGGNQQKVILARWLGENIKILLMDEPTRGIDVGTKNEIYKIMYNLAGEGKGIIFVSSDLPEVMGVADRVVIMREGHFVESVDRKDLSQEKILSHALPIND
ncbi:MAG: L-arabinose ABC transporter ATP-binding protein AraG [Spirochaetes bacterium]|nr:MAG: L-arabinose ABC transporter ATP-binding protein AraG [Spirochaetota bacterium]RKX98265.1 MAG: L-arabinose ABC transporter ATP-binding protein AraG [Spirochaetota bacterium]